MTDKLLERVLGDPTKLPPRFKDWVPKHVQNTDTIKFLKHQLPDVGKLAGFPGGGTSFLRDDGTFAVVTSGTQAFIDVKTTQKDVVNTNAETDLLNGEIALGADWLGPNGFAILDASGDILNNSGTTPTITLRIKLGTTTLWAATTGAMSSNANRGFWYAHIVIFNAAATNAQKMSGFIHATAIGTAAATGEGGYAGTGAGVGLINGVMGGTAAEDTTALKNLAFTAQWSTANANESMRLNRAVLHAFKV